MYRRVQIQRAPKLGHGEDRPHAALQPLTEMPSSAPPQARGDGRAWVWRARLGARSFTDKRRKSFFINNRSQHYITEAGEPLNVRCGSPDGSPRSKITKCLQNNVTYKISISRQKISRTDKVFARPTTVACSLMKPRFKTSRGPSDLAFDKCQILLHNK